MSFWILKPEPTLDANLVSSTIAEDDATEWASGTTYDTGDLAMIAAEHRVYSSLTDGNIGSSPLEPEVPPVWFDEGPTNRWRPFEVGLSHVAEAAGSIEYELTYPERITGLALFGLEAATVTLEVRDGATLIWDQTVDTVDRAPIVDFTSYHFEPLRTRSRALFLEELPPVKGAALTLTISNPGGTARVGRILPGRLLKGLEVRWSTELTDRSFGRVTQAADGTFDAIVKGPVSKVLDLPVAMPTAAVERWWDLLGGLAETEAVYITRPAAPLPGLAVYGMRKDFRVVMQDHVETTANLRVESFV
jgi:hypothetical protein